MQAISAELPSAQERGEQGAFSVRLEVFAYVALFVLALVLRLAELDSVPLSHHEAQDSLAAWALVFPQTPSSPAPATSPIGHALQVIAFNLLGASEFSARLGSMLGGMVLVLMPLLFRSRIGIGRAFLFSSLLALSPHALIASRTGEPLVWTMVFALGAAWALWAYWDDPSEGKALVLAGLVGALVFLSEPSAVLFSLVLGLALMAGLWWTAFNAAEALERPAETLFNQVRYRWSAFPIRSAVLLVAGLVFVSATLFMLMPQGLGVVGNLLGTGISAIWTPAEAQMPTAVGVLSLVLYDPLLLVLALVGVFVLQGENRLSVPDRIAFAVFGFGVLVLALIQGATPAWGLWLSVPLAWIVSHVAEELMTHRPTSIFWLGEFQQDSELYTYRYNWVKWFLGIVVCALLVTLLMHLQEVGRGFLAVPTGQSFNDTLSLMFSETLGMFRYSLIWSFVTLIFLVVGFFLVASVWGNTNSLQGLGLGVFGFMLISGMGAGWNASVVQAHNPAEYWYLAQGAVQADAPLLRRTLLDVAQRETRGFANLEVAVVLDPTLHRAEQAQLAWALRDFAQARFVASVEEAQNAPLIITPMQADASTPALGNAYVGQSFRLGRAWQMSEFSVLDGLGWWLTRQLRNVEQMRIVPQTVTLWLRVDIFHSSPFSESTN